MKIAVLAEQNFNLIDGSTIWLLNLCKLLALRDDMAVTLILAHPLTDRVLAAELPLRITLVDATAMGQPAGTPLAASTLVGSVCDWEAAHGRFDRILVRGESFLSALLESANTQGRLIGFAPGVLPDLTHPEPEWLAVGRAIRMPVVVQSDVAKRVLESLCDYPAHVVHVVPPIVFETGLVPGQIPSDRSAAAPAILCYSGKIDPEYGLDWLIGLAQTLRGPAGFGAGFAISLIAGKDTGRDRHRAFFAQMDSFRAAIGAGEFPGVTLAVGLPHAAARAAMAQADFAWCLRHPRYDDVIEISTKIVEFCAAGVPPVLNDTALNRALFGADYPYLIDMSVSGQNLDQPNLPSRLATLLHQIMAGRGSPAHVRARSICASVAARFSAAGLSGALGRAIRGHDAASNSLTARPRHILIATHEDKFLRQFLDRITVDPAVRIDWQRWHSSVGAGKKVSVPAHIDTVFCEWCCENAVWHSQNKRPGTKLIIRLHRFEAFRDFPARVNWAAVDTLIVVSGHFRDLMVAEHGVDPARIHVWPQFIDWRELQRPKLPEARFTLGLVGINPFGHKRFDRAIDFLATLRARDPRFTLAVRSVMPWQIGWVWDNQPEERERFLQVFRRIYSDPLLTGAVRFDPAGPDMEEWYRGIGTILSSSDSEGCHTSVIEGMASGCHPVVHDWPGARSLFAPYVHADMTDAIDGLISIVDSSALDKARQSYAELARKYDIETFAQSFFAL